ncbi:MAG: hypothetical protein EOQ42_35335 [Mesorhizobium sp.]|nr:MAG: hypothetical protein EOQ42_35335 [Mesorhizobium sp.]
MVLQVRADILIGVNDGNTERSKERRGTDAGKLQQLRRVDRAARQNDFVAGAGSLRLTVLQVLNANGTLALKKDSGRQRIHLDADVFALHRRPQEGTGGRHAAAVFGGDLVDAGAFLGDAVEIRVERQAGLIGGRQIALGERMD